MHKNYILILVIVLVSAACGRKSAAGSDFIDLRGTWRIAYEDRDLFKEESFDESSWKEIKVPSTWRGLASYESIAWYRTRFPLPADRERTGLAFTFTANDADEAYINGHRIGQSASIEDTSVHAYGQMRLYPIPSEFLHEGSNVVAVRVRGYVPQNSGINQGIVGIGNLLQLEAVRAGAEVRAFSFAVAYVVTGLYFLILYVRVPALRTHLSFALFCLFLGTYILLRISALQETLGFNTAKRFEYLALFCMPVFFCAFWHEFLRWRRRWVTALIAAYFAAFLFVPFVLNGPAQWNASLIFWHPAVGTLALVIIIFLIRRAIAGDREARIMLGGTIIFTITIVNDSLDDRGLLATTRISEYGFLAFVVSMSASLVQTFVSLQREQTKTLEKLTAMDELKEHLLANVTEILSEPAGAISANVRRLRDAGGADADIASELMQQGSKMNDALDGVLLLSRLQSGVETAELRIVEAAELRDIAPIVEWSPKTKIVASPAVLGVFFRAVSISGGQVIPTPSGGVRFELPPAEQGRAGELEQALLAEAARILGARLQADSIRGRSVEIPAAV